MAEVEHYPSKCSFCTKKMTFHVEKGAKVIDKPCGCKHSVEALKKRGAKA